MIHAVMYALACDICKKPGGQHDTGRNQEEASVNMSDVVKRLYAVVKRIENGQHSGVDPYWAQEQTRKELLNLIEAIRVAGL
jgi:predicted kinase